MLNVAMHWRDDGIHDSRQQPPIGWLTSGKVNALVGTRVTAFWGKLLRAAHKEGCHLKAKVPDTQGIAPSGVGVLRTHTLSPKEFQQRTQQPI